MTDEESVVRRACPENQSVGVAEGEDERAFERGLGVAEGSWVEGEGEGDDG